MLSELLGKRVVIFANDYVSHDLSATIIMIDEEVKKLVLALDGDVQQIDAKYVIASPRLAKDKLDDLFRSGRVGCSIVWIPKEKYNPGDPADLSWWRGGGAAITDIMLLD